MLSLWVMQLLAHFYISLRLKKFSMPQNSMLWEILGHLVASALMMLSNHVLQRRNTVTLDDGTMSTCLLLKDPVILL